MSRYIYNEEDSSMEASEGLNPVSSQGYAEVQSVEARSMAKAGLIEGTQQKLRQITLHLRQVDLLQKNRRCELILKTYIMRRLAVPIHSRIFLANSFGLNLDERIFFKIKTSLSALGHRNLGATRCLPVYTDRPPFC